MSSKDITKTTKGLKLLYIEDNYNARASILSMFENFFNDITIAVDGQDGLEKFRQNTFDIIISDINMPKLSGIELLKEIRKSDEEIPVLFLSAYNETSYLLESIKLGVDGYILKPLQLNQFIGAIKKIVEKINLKKQNEYYKDHLEQKIKEQTAELEKKIYFDELTGLYSRYSFFEDIKNVAVPILLIVDIDKFKVINEIYGTSIGSFVLKKFAGFLTDFTYKSSYEVYRLSGDEFVLFDNVAYFDPEKYERDISHFFKLLSDFKVDIGGDTISIEATIGISTSQEDAFESAKVALDFAKIHKKPYAMYSSAIDKRNEEQDALLWKDKIKSAIQDNRIRAVYQPIVNKAGEIVKYETLMRLKDAESDKLISPFFFLDIAIKTRLYNALSTCIVFEALHLLGRSSYLLSLNFAYDDIKNSAFLNEIEVFFKTSPELGKRAVFEITESESVGNYDDVKEFTNRFRPYGIRFAIDDFGSGFSNFEHILEIEPDYIKIDGSLIKNIDTDEKSHVLVKAIVQFSHELGIKVIAEYVHSEMIFKMLKELDVDEYQGFYFSEPLEEI